MKPPNGWRAPEPALEIVPTEREEREREPRRPHEDFWLWNTDPAKVPARKEKVS